MSSSEEDIAFDDQALADVEDSLIDLNDFEEETPVEQVEEPREDEDELIKFDQEEDEEKEEIEKFGTPVPATPQVSASSLSSDSEKEEEEEAEKVAVVEEKKETTTTWQPAASSSSSSSSSTITASAARSSSAVKSATPTSSTPSAPSGPQSKAAIVVANLKRHPFMHNVCVKWSHIIDAIDADVARFPGAALFRDRVGLSFAYVWLALTFLLFVLVAFNAGAELICTLVGTVYPAYASLDAMKTAGTDVSKAWLAYWSLFGLLRVAEHFVVVLLYLWPSYYVLKFVFLVWATMPFTNGVHIVFDQIVKRLLVVQRFMSEKMD
jgi:receptor expression-enhancing protein 5/6